jgi:hypothetical protein
MTHIEAGKIVCDKYPHAVYDYKYLQVGYYNKKYEWCCLSDSYSDPKDAWIDAVIRMNLNARSDDGEQVTEPAYKSGARSSAKAPRYDLIKSSLLDRLAARLELGASKYGENNYQKGLADKEFLADRYNHILAHLLAYKTDGCKNDDNLAAAAFGIMLLIEAETVKKSL